MRFAYADPPYIGCAMAHYGKAEVGHEFLINLLLRDYPDGWALSCSSPTLHQILTLCPPDVRWGVWVKPFCSYKPNVNPAFAFEPVIWRGGRTRERKDETVRDWVSACITTKRGVHGAKPYEFCAWVFDLLNIQEGDEFEDMFPGSMAVTKALDIWLRQRDLFK